MSPPSYKALQRALLDWYGKHQRDLPWRRSADPYAIWVSEILLQQTQVTTAEPYYKGFLRKFPTVQTLANAPLDDVLKAWEGLGYYARARNLHRAAQQVVLKFNGTLPQTIKELRTLPGIGAYTAGAIASIAFGLDEPVLDGNVTRVLCRVFRVRDNPKESATQESLWRLARALIPSGQASTFNQALMDLGATVCVPKQPRCLSCPLYDRCSARKHNEQAQLPFKAKRTPTPHHHLAVGVVWKDDRLLLVQRPTDQLLGGLWEFPGGKLKANESKQRALARHLEALGVRIRVKAPIASVKHAFTHFRITMHAFACTYVSGTLERKGVANLAWVSVDDLDRYALPKATHKVIAALKLTYSPCLKAGDCGVKRGLLPKAGV